MAHQLIRVEFVSEVDPGLACWIDDGFVGVTFNRLIPLGELVSWLNEQRDMQRGRARA